MSRTSLSRYLLLLVWTGTPVVATADGIPTQQLTMVAPPPGKATVEALLPGEVKEVTTEHVSLSGPIAHEERADANRDTVYLFLSGRGRFHSGEQTFEIDEATIAHAPLGTAVTIEVPKGDALHYVRIHKQLLAKDLADMEAYPPQIRTRVYFKRFRDCRAYSEAIKSAKTVSRTLLPENHVPRVAMGTVETTGPDEVGAHRHPMLDQLFLSLDENEVIVHADEEQVDFPPYALLHIPLGASHWVVAPADRKLHYVWMDFFSSKEGQKWLEMHEPVEE